MYDAVAFFKHRSEGETNNTFQYTHPELRVSAVRRCREILWALDCAWSNRPELGVVTNFVRLFGGPLFITMRRYRYIEDGCTIGKEETAEIVSQARQNRKLWNRIDAVTSAPSLTTRYYQALESSDKLMFEGMSEMLKADQTRHCGKCQARNSYGSNELHRFGGVKLCNACKDDWRRYIESLPQRAIKAFGEINSSAVIGKV